MDLKTYLKSLADDDARTAFAAACETSLGHMRNTIYVEGKLLSPESCVLAEKVSGGAVTRRDLRPDWRRIWPELADEPLGEPTQVGPATSAEPGIDIPPNQRDPADTHLFPLPKSDPQLQKEEDAMAQVGRTIEGNVKAAKGSKAGEGA